jgi:hypothetical protein
VRPVHRRRRDTTDIASGVNVAPCPVQRDRLPSRYEIVVVPVVDQEDHREGQRILRLTLA